MDTIFCLMEVVQGMELLLVIIWNLLLQVKKHTVTVPVDTTLPLKMRQLVQLIVVQ